jgi:predicted RNase H-like HicB family nuclease
VKGYVVVIEGDDGSGYSAYSPDLPGVVAAADSRAEIEQLMREAVVDHVTLLRELGREVPEPSEVCGLTVVASPAA